MVNYMIETLKTIATRYGHAILADGNKLIAYYADLAPTHEQERQMLEYLVKCNGNRSLLLALQQEPAEQMRQLRILEDRLMNKCLVSQEHACHITYNYWVAIGGDVQIMQTSEKFASLQHPEKTEIVTYKHKPKSKKLTLFLAIFPYTGWFGVHRYYVGKVGTGIVYSLTCGIYFIGWIIDIIKICSGTFKDAWGRDLV